MLNGVCIALVIGIPLLNTVFIQNNQVGFAWLAFLIWIGAALLWIALDGNRFVRFLILVAILLIWMFVL
ncbi:MAG: hypothetical protein NVSMB39_4600 [Candidatus Saccharimonadales bacterium]